MDAFVDDTTLYNNNFNDPDQSVEKLVQQMQEAAQWWEELLSATGGKLELPKCFYYIIHWSFDEEGAHYLTPIEELEKHQIAITSHDPLDYGKTHYITQKDPNEEHRSLGFMAHPLAKLSAEYKKLKEKGQKYAARIRGNATTIQETKTIYSAYYLQGMGHALAMTNFTKEEMDAIQAAPKAAFLNAAGYNRNTPKEVTYGPQEMLGLGFNDLFPLQNGKKLSLLIGHLREGGQVGQHARIALSWLQKQVGTSFAVLEEPNIPIKSVRQNWFMGLRDYLATINAKLVIDGIPTVKKRRQHDVVIMDAVYQLNLPKKQQERINRMRIYLQVECLSDLCNMQGTHLNYWPSSHSYTMWPNQKEPGPKTKKAWRSFLNRFTKGRTRTLKQQLGPWTETEMRIMRAYYDDQWLYWHDAEEAWHKAPYKPVMREYVGCKWEADLSSKAGIARRRHYPGGDNSSR